MSYGQSEDYNNTTQGSTGGGFDSSAQRSRDTDPTDEFSSAQRRDTSGDSGGQRGGGQQGRDPMEQQGGADPGFGGQEGGDTTGYGQPPRRAAGAGLGAGARDEGYGQSGNEGQYGQSGTGEKVSMMDKIKGTAEKMTGKVTHDSDRVQAGQARQEGRFDSGGGH